MNIKLWNRLAVGLLCLIAAAHLVLSAFFLLGDPRPRQPARIVNLFNSDNTLYAVARIGWNFADEDKTSYQLFKLDPQGQLVLVGETDLAAANYRYSSQIDDRELETLLEDRKTSINRSVQEEAITLKMEYENDFYPSLVAKVHSYYYLSQGQRGILNLSTDERYFLPGYEEAPPPRWWTSFAVFASLYFLLLVALLGVLHRVYRPEGSYTASFWGRKYLYYLVYAAYFVCWDYELFQIDYRLGAFLVISLLVAYEAVQRALRSRKAVPNVIK